MDNTVNIISLLFVILIAIVCAYQLIKNNNVCEKRLKFESIRDDHALVLAEMHRLIIEFNDKYTSWMLYKSMSDNTPMCLLYKQQYNDLVRYVKRWKNHVDSEYQEKILTLK
jgi:hypothetical protein